MFVNLKKLSKQNVEHFLGQVRIILGVLVYSEQKVKDSIYKLCRLRAGIRQASGRLQDCKIQAIFNQGPSSHKAILEIASRDLKTFATFKFEKSLNYLCATI